MSIAFYVLQPMNNRGLYQVVAHATCLSRALKSMEQRKFPTQQRNIIALVAEGAARIGKLLFFQLFSVVWDKKRSKWIVDSQEPKLTNIECCVRRRNK